MIRKWRHYRAKQRQQNQRHTLYGLRLCTLMMWQAVRKALNFGRMIGGYKEGDVLELMEFKDGRNTGREIKADIIYMLEDYSGLEEGWCILGIKVRPEEKKEADLPGQMDIEEYLGKEEK